MRRDSYQMVYALIMGGALVEQLCLKKWTATHEAAKVGCVDILMLLLRYGGTVRGRDLHGVTPLGIAAEYGHPKILDILIQTEFNIAASSQGSGQLSLRMGIGWISDGMSITPNWKSQKSLVHRNRNKGATYQHKPPMETLYCMKLQALGTWTVLICSYSMAPILM